MVDGFRWSSDWCAHYFLTHGHSDHYTGLKDTWSHGIIYCSHITARVVQVRALLPTHSSLSIHERVSCSPAKFRLLTRTRLHAQQCKLGLPPERFCVLPMRREVTVEGVRVTLVDANHCPGAVQILFQLPDGKRFLHCGDMRYHPSMQQVRAKHTWCALSQTQPPFRCYLWPRQGAAYKCEIDLERLW
jgi:Cft2 family RNA processing exonuclease